MAFPAGPLPGQSDLTGTFVPFKSVAFTAGGSDLDLTDPANKMQPCAYELYCTTSGNIIAQLAGDAAPQTYPVSAGQVLQGAFTLVKGTSTANAMVRK